jgi:hypothetical protein
MQEKNQKSIVQSTEGGKMIEKNLLAVWMYILYFLNLVPFIWNLLLEKNKIKDKWWINVNQNEWFLIFFHWIDQ